MAEQSSDHRLAAAWGTYCMNWVVVALVGRRHNRLVVRGRLDRTLLFDDVRVTTVD